VPELNRRALGCRTQFRWFGGAGSLRPSATRYAVAPAGSRRRRDTAKPHRSSTTSKRTQFPTCGTAWTKATRTSRVSSIDSAVSCNPPAPRAIFRCSGPWTRRLINLIDHDFPGLSAADQLVAWAGQLRAVDFAQDCRSDAPGVRRLTERLLQRLAVRAPADTSNLRLMASLVLIEHAGATGQSELFERAVDSVVEDLAAGDLAPWVLGDWLVNFGSATARYFIYARRGFPYASPEEALREAIEIEIEIEIGKQERLRGVEFGALYHLQLLMKLRGDFSEFEVLIARLAEIADSRNTTQVAVVADCQAAVHTFKGNHAGARAACERFMAAIEGANEPLFDGALRCRAEACIKIARTFDAKWRNTPDYPTELGACMTELRHLGWPAILINLPRHLAELCADGLERGFEAEFCRELTERRRQSAIVHQAADAAPESDSVARAAQVSGAKHRQSTVRARRRFPRSELRKHRFRDR